MRIRIDLKILLFLIIFYFTNQIRIYIIIMFFCFLHELGHILIGIILNVKPNKVEIIPCGFSTSFKANLKDKNYKIKNGNLLEVKKIIIAFAGPITSLIIAIMSGYINTQWVSSQDIIYSNILIMIFNLIPIYPLDGGQIIKSILHIQLGEEKSKEIIKIISNIVIVILLIIGSIAVYYFKNIAIFFICIFLLTKNYLNNKLKIYY